MSAIPQPVTTRRVALANEYGLGLYELTADGFTEDYCTVIQRPTTLALDIRVTFVIEAGMYQSYRVWWKDEDRARAREAIDGDYAEMVSGNHSTPRRE